MDREVAYDIVDQEVRECLGRLGGGKPGIEFTIEAIERSGGRVGPAVLQLIKDFLKEADANA